MNKLAALFVFCVIASPQVAEHANQEYKTKDERDKIARQLLNPVRNERDRPREIVDQMDLQPGESAADVGTGAGFMLPYLSRAVGATGIVYAEDIFQDFLNQAMTRGFTLDLENIKFILGTEKDPYLPSATLSGVLMLDVYNYLNYPEAILGHIRDSLVSDGKLVIVDYYKRRGAMPNSDPDRPLDIIRLDENDLINEVTANGFRVTEKHELVPKSQYIVTFMKK